MRNDSITFARAEDVYEYCQLNQPNFNFDGATDINSLLIKQSRFAIAQITGYFNDPSFDPIKNWLEKMIELAINFRASNPTFPLDIARGGKLSVNTVFLDFFNSVGTPLITNNKDETTLFDPRGGPTLLNYPLIWAIDQIH